MADGLLIISEPLCFIRKKFGNIPEKELKDIVREFYNVDVLILAKNILADDFKQYQPEGWTPPVAHRDLPGRALKEVDDIFAIFNLADQLLVLDKLPTYVAESPDRLPSIKWRDGEYKL